PREPSAGQSIVSKGRLHGDLATPWRRPTALGRKCSDDADLVRDPHGSLSPLGKAHRGPLTPCPAWTSRSFDIGPSSLAGKAGSSYFRILLVPAREPEPLA